MWQMRTQGINMLPNNLKVIQWNARSLKPKWPEVMQKLNTNHIHLGLIQESWLNDNYIFKLNCHSHDFVCVCIFCSSHMLT